MITSLLVNANIQELTTHNRSLREAASLTDSLLMRVSQVCPANPSDARDPMFYIPFRMNRIQPPRLITGRQLYTRWIAENAYECEALRLLALNGRGRDPVEYMLSVADRRLRLAGAHIPREMGEEPIFTLAALRFWSAHRPMDTTLQDRLLSVLAAHITDDGSIDNLDAPPFYVWLTLLTTPSDKAVCLLSRFLPRLTMLDALPWPDDPSKKLRRAIVAAAVKRCVSANVAV